MKMIWEGREVENNGCKYHKNCFTCPFKRCMYDVVEKPEVSQDILARRAYYRAKYYANKEKILANRKRREQERKNGKSNNTVQFVHEG